MSPAGSLWLLPAFFCPKKSKRKAAKPPNKQLLFPTSVGAVLPRRLGRQLSVRGVPGLGSEPAGVGLCGDSGPLPGRVPRPEPRGEGLLTPARLAVLLRGRRGAGYPGSLMAGTRCRCGCSRPSCPPSAASALEPGGRGLVIPAAAGILRGPQVLRLRNSITNHSPPDFLTLHVV